MQQPNTPPMRIVARLTVVVSISLLILLGPFGLLPTLILVPLLIADVLTQRVAPCKVQAVNRWESGK